MRNFTIRRWPAIKLFHLSDLHLGRRLHEFSLLEDQRHILGSVLDEVRREAPEGVIIAGDVYDKAVPSAEAVMLFDDFIFGLASLKTEVFIVSGNHDSPERLSVFSRIIKQSGVHIAPVWEGAVSPVTLTDSFGGVDIFLLPFFKPAQAKRFFPDDNIESYTDAVAAAVSRIPLTPARRSVLVTHHFVTGAQRSDSETVSVGGADNVEAHVFSPFDYVALGHLHRPQNIGGRIRYSGSPLKYSFSECSDKKSITVVELAEKGSLSVRTIPLIPLRDMREIRGSYGELTSRKSYLGEKTEDYIRAVLTDEHPVPYAMAKLQLIYPNLMRLDYDNAAARASLDINRLGEMNAKSPFELFGEFYKAQNGLPMSAEQSEYILALIRRLSGEGEK